MSNWKSPAERYGLKYKRGRGRRLSDRMSGAIGGHRVSVSDHRSGLVEIQVRFKSGLPSVSLSRRTSAVSAGDDRAELSTDDMEFDKRYRLRETPGVSSADTLKWLNPTRRSVLLAIDEAFIVKQIDENELEVRIESEAPTDEEIGRAIDLLILAAKALDESAENSEPDTGESDGLEPLTELR